VVGVAAQVEVAHGVQEFDEAFVAARDGRAELGAVDVEVVEQALEVALALGADR